MSELNVFTCQKLILGYNDDGATMDEIFRIFESYESRKRPYIGKQMNVTGSVDNDNCGLHSSFCPFRNFLNCQKANMYVSSISKLSQEDMHYNMDCAFRQFWNDPRLDLTKFTDKETTVDEKFLSELWIPDLVFANSVSSARHHVVKRNALFRIVSPSFLMLKK